MQNDGDLVEVILRYIVIHTVRILVCHVTDEETHSCLNLSIITIMLVVVVVVVVVVAVIIIIIIKLYNLNRTHRKYIPPYGVRT